MHKNHQRVGFLDAIFLMILFAAAALSSLADDNRPAKKAQGEAVADENESAVASRPKWGHSHLGPAFDKGPRTKPWVFEGIGKTHFPITSKHAEVQQWFDQGNTLLHAFSYFEAERSFRWCIKLDPDCAMAYWGLARCVKFDDQRALQFLQQASQRKQTVTQRERDYIELWEAKFAINQSDGDRDSLVREYTVLFDRLLLRYPDDIEAKCLYWIEVPSVIDPQVTLYNIPYRSAMESMLQEVLRVAPNHVGALHYRIHNWDSEESHVVVDSCRRIQKVAPNSGHLQHMPGHIFEELGLWNEAAIAMDAATRVEKEYMHRRLILPEQNWDYFHNLSYLCYLQEQLGLAEDAMFSAEQLLRGPRDVEGGHYRALKKIPMLRVLIKYQRWQDILEEERTLLGWDPDNAIEQFLRHYARSYALLGTDALAEAEAEIAKARTLFDQLVQAQRQKSEPKQESEDAPLTLSLAHLNSVLGWKVEELEGELALARGDHRLAVEKLSAAAEKQQKNWSNDPPLDPVFLSNRVGEARLANGEPRLAVEAFQRTLKTVAKDGFALSGLVRAHMQLGETDQASQAYGELLEVWADADRPNRWLDAAADSGVPVPAAPKDDRPHQRSYKRDVLERQGPSFWVPPKAPVLRATDSKGRQRTLQDYAGRNVILIFYLGGECLHCMEQMQEANRRAAAFGLLDTDIVAISKDKPATIADYEKSGFRVTLLSDPDFVNAKRFRSFDDFEEIELHSTLLIDKQGRIHWSRHGGPPFMDFGFLENEVKRLNRIVRQPTAGERCCVDFLFSRVSANECLGTPNQERPFF